MRWGVALLILAAVSILTLFGDLMAYSGIDSWQATLVPALKARLGDPDPVGFDEGWGDEQTLSAFEEDDTEELEPQAVTPVLPGIEARPEFNFILPDEPDEGRRKADENAAKRGVNPGRKDGGIGHLFDLARTFIGTPYVFGAGGPTAFDCSGFVQYLFGRVFGANLPHSAAGQHATTKAVSREELQPGDLIFYRYGRLGRQVDHVEVFMGEGKQIGTSNPSEDLDIDNVDWNNVAGFGRVAGARKAFDPAGPKAKTKVVTRPAERDLTNVPNMLDYGSNALAGVLAGVFTDDVIATRRKKTPAFKGPKGGVKAQLYRGFLDAGREDLARMVRTRDFDTWINAESGWRADATSPANNHGKANDGYFQVWRGHDFNSQGQVARMSPYEQAQIVAKYFSHLTPEAIRSYAEEIRAGRYHGWG